MEAVRVVKEPRGCQIDGCNRKHEARGWCQKHYGNWQATGDPPYRVNNNWSALMSRWAMDTCPDLRGAFRLRERIST